MPGRHMRAVRHGCRAETACPVVLEDHRLCGASSQELRYARLAREDEGDAEELDREEGRYRHHILGGWLQRTNRLLHHPPRHKFRCDLYCPRTRTPLCAKGRQWSSTLEREGSRCGVPRGYEEEDGAGTPGGRPEEDRRIHGVRGDQQPQRSEDADLGVRLRPCGVRDGGSSRRSRP